MMPIYIITAIAALVGGLVSAQLKSKMRKYGQMSNNAGKTGAELASEMLSFYNVEGVKIVAGQGFLTDHYNPATKTVSLSPEIFQGRSVAAAAVAAHEVGHAIQHATAYKALQFRSKMVPVVKFASSMQRYLLFASLAMLSQVPQLMMVTLIAFGVTTLFSLMTLPVEFDASRRALVWLDESQALRGGEYEGAKDALWWAAMTYVVAAMAALVSFLYLLMRFMNANR